MLKRYARFNRILFLLTDVAIISGCWTLPLYFQRIEQWPISLSLKTPLIKEHAVLLIPTIAVYTIIFRLFNLYEPKRTSSLFNELHNIVKASLTSLFILGLFLYVSRKVNYSASSLALFGLSTAITLSIFRIFLRTGLRLLRRKGYNLRHILIVGTGKLAKTVAKKIHERQEFGLEIIGFLANNPQDVSTTEEVEIIGSYKDIRNIVLERNVDQVIFALPQTEYRMLLVLLGHIHDTTVNIRIVPDIRHNFFTLCHGVEDFDGLPVIRLRESLVHGHNRILKRCFDFCIALGVFILSVPWMALIAILVKIESLGPVFYKQERMGLDGKVFSMLKFRSMREDAEAQTGPVWAKADDPRRTKVGQFLRKTSLDELPQLINVLKGEMSLVGPRPERPVFIEEFKRQIPAYMLRHKMKAGITGWAQIHGLRGNTSLEKRIEYDIYYIENWSILLDIKILLLTIPAVLKGEEAY